jgi:thiaminase/transcriptional activator TenA
LECLAFATGAIKGEMILHQQFFKRFNIIPQSEKSLSCLAYTQFVLATAAQASFAESMAALLPCFWIYREVGLHLQKNLNASHPYRDWIESYASAEFNVAVEKAIAITDRAAEHVSERVLEKMQSLFMTSSKLEWEFWDEAYKMPKQLCSSVEYSTYLLLD